MRMTIIEKILARASGRDRVSAGDTVVRQVDMNVLIDLMFTSWPDVARIADRTAIILDHSVPAPTLTDANATAVARRCPPTSPRSSSTTFADASSASMALESMFHPFRIKTPCTPRCALLTWEPSNRVSPGPAG